MLWCWLGFEGSFFEIFGSLDVCDSSEIFTRLTDRLWQLIRRELACCESQIETGVFSRVRDREKKDVLHAIHFFSPTASRRCVFALRRVMVMNVGCVTFPFLVKPEGYKS